MSEACRHFISFKKACPWCKREAETPFKVKTNRQIMQTQFDKFMQEHGDKIKTPKSFAFIVQTFEEGNFVYYYGDPEELAKCLDQKSSNGLLKRLSSMWSHHKS